MANGLDSEIAKLDVKFSPRHTGVSKFFTEYCFYDFWIRYCSPQAVEMTGDGLIVCIHRFKPDATGRDDLAVLDTRYPRSLDGLTAARNDGLTAVEKLYGLPPDIKILDMKILKKDIRHGEIKLLVETPEDVWYVSQLLDPGDTIKGKTPRKVKVSEEADATKRMVLIALTVEKADFSKTTNALRASGKIIEGPEDVPHGTYHTFAIEPGSTITITKEHWYGYQLDRIKEAA